MSHSMMEKPLPNATLYCWSDADSGQWAWRLSCRQHALEDHGRYSLERADPEAIASHCLTKALERLKKPCTLTVYQYPDALPDSKIPGLPAFMDRDSVNLWISPDGQAPTMQYLASLSRML